MRVEDRKNGETLPRFVTTTRTRIINPCAAVPCTLYLPVITIFFHLLSLLSSPIPGEAHFPPLSSLRSPSSRVANEEETPTLDDSCSHTRGVNRRIYMCASAYVIFSWYSAVSRFAGGTEYRRGIPYIDDAIRTGNLGRFPAALPALSPRFCFHVALGT